MRILIVGGSGSSHIGGSFFRAAERIGHGAEFLDVAGAWQHGTLLQKILWHFGGHRPVHLGRFSRRVVQASASFHPDILFSTGMAPVSAAALDACRQLGIRCANYSTDDPFNPGCRAPWFLRALAKYDAVFSPRRANLEDLRRHGCARVEYLPFGYDPDLFYPPTGPIMDGAASDLFFAGTAADDRVPFIDAALKAGLDVRLHGIYWDKYPETRCKGLGQADVPTLRKSIHACRVALCLVRRENRDGNSMRTFEVPAVGACMAVEDTKEHREIFGDDGMRVVYFKTPGEMVEKTKWLLEHRDERERMKLAAHEHIVNGRNTYGDRLAAMIDFCQEQMK
jgi:spore maturation protein CgeB